MIGIEELRRQSAALLVAIRRAEAAGRVGLVSELLSEKYVIDRCVYDIGRARHEWRRRRYADDLR